MPKYHRNREGTEGKSHEKVEVNAQKVMKENDNSAQTVSLSSGRAICSLYDWFHGDLPGPKDVIYRLEKFIKGGIF